MHPIDRKSNFVYSQKTDMEQIEKEGYVKEAHTIDMWDANKYGCSMMFPAFLFYAVPYILIWRQHLSVDFFLGFAGDWGLSPMWNGVVHGIIPILVIVVGIVLHELIHGIFWSIYAKNGWKSIKFGIMKEHFTPYCHCKEPLKVKHYIIGAVMPLIILGIIPGVVAWFNGNWPLLLFGFFFTISAIGDMMIINLVRKLDKDTYVQDHPSEAGYYVFTKVEE